MHLPIYGYLQIVAFSLIRYLAIPLAYGEGQRSYHPVANTKIQQQQNEMAK